MANLTKEQEAMNRFHSDNGSTCLPNCWRSHYGDPKPKRKCDHCDDYTDTDNESVIRHNEYHLRHPETIKY